MRKRLLQGVDGRTAGAVRFKRLINSFSTDFGGMAALTAGRGRSGPAGREPDDARGAASGCDRPRRARRPRRANPADKHCPAGARCYQQARERQASHPRRLSRKSRCRMNIIEACHDEELLARWFRKGTWKQWFAVLAALFALPMSEAQLATYRQHTGRQEPPVAPFTEGWLICGRRAGKSFILAVVAVYLGCFRSYAEHLGPGEHATVMVIATDRRQARVIFRYIRALITLTPLLKAMIERETADVLDLDNHVTIEIVTASYRTARGYTLAAVLCDELAFWPTDDSAEPDYAVLDALRPGMVTIPGAMLLCASSPYAKRGALWDSFRRYFGTDDRDVLVWKAATREMNPSVPPAVVNRAIERDPASAGAEYNVDFRSDIDSFIPSDVVEAAVSQGVFERAPLHSVEYVAFVDPSGGSADSMTMAIAHREGKSAVLDAVREVKPPFSPERVVADFAELLSTASRGCKVIGSQAN